MTQPALNGKSGKITQNMPIRECNRKGVKMKQLLAISICMASYLLGTAVYAADTTETFDPGASDFEFYAGVDGIGKGKYEKTVSAEALLGYGLMERFSGYLAAGGEANERFGDGAGWVGLGIFGTPVDTDHFDLDLMLDAGFGASDFSLAPSLELNIDLDPEMRTWGMYVRVSENFMGRDETPDAEPGEIDCESVYDTQSGGRTIVCAQQPDETADPKFELAPVTGVTVGTYYTISEKHQLLLEYDMAFANNPAKDEEDTEIGGVALGYNVVLSDSIEMINQLFFDIPQDGEDFSLGISLGIVATMPGGADSSAETVSPVQEGRNPAEKEEAE